MKPDVVFPYSQPGCRDGCKYRLPNTEELKTNYNEKLRHYYTVLEITPHCSRETERAAFRVTVYEKANAAVEAAHKRCTTLRGKLRAADKGWKEATAPWVIGPCPFFEPVETVCHDPLSMVLGDRALPDK
jgi:hypothetical protein